MKGLRILVVDDAPNWQTALPEILRRIGEAVQVVVAASYDDARHYIGNEHYDLAIVDLALPDRNDPLGMALLRIFRESSQNEHIGLIVLTGYPSIAYFREATREYRIYDFLEKDTFDPDHLIVTARAAILHAHLRWAEIKHNTRYQLTITVSQDQVVSTELTGPGRGAEYFVQPNLALKTLDLARRTDNLSLLALKGGPEVWRPEARSIGDELYRMLSGEQRVMSDLAAARELAPHFSDLWLQFRSPAVGLGAPFELLRQEGSYLGLHSILTRRLAQSGARYSRKTEPFFRFIDEEIIRREQPLRILVVGANADGFIPLAEEEATAVVTCTRQSLQRLGIRHEITSLIGPAATYARVRDELRDGRYHIFHYAGHGQYREQIPDTSGIVLRDGDKLRSITASDLGLLAPGTPLRFTFMSCCLGARTASQVGRGDFHSVLEALASADIPVVLGYRWSVRDQPAMRLAVAFYEDLWRTFSPGQALLSARRSIALDEQGLDDETWAAPVLLMQTT